MSELYQHHAAIGTLIVSYNNMNGLGLSLATPDNCVFNEETGEYSIPLQGISQIRYAALVDYLRDNYPSADIEFSTHTAYKEDTLIVVNLYRNNNVAGGDGGNYNYNNGAPGRSSGGCCSCLCRLVFFLMLVVLCLTLVAGLVWPETFSSAVQNPWEFGPAAAYRGGGGSGAHRSSFSNMADLGVQSHSKHRRAAADDGSHDNEQAAAAADGLLYKAFSWLARTVYADDFSAGNAVHGRRPNAGAGSHSRGINEDDESANQSTDRRARTERDQKRTPDPVSGVPAAAERASANDATAEDIVDLRTLHNHRDL